jgi:hypothetical protein
VVAIDSMGNSASDASDHTFTLVGDSLAFAFTADWYLMGTPLKPTDSTVSGIFTDDISEPFYVYDYSPSTGYVQPTWLKHGKGYWLGLLHNFSVDVIGAAVTDQHIISLDPGFNIISDPLVVPVPKDSLKFRKDGSTTTYADAISNGWIATGIQGYDRIIKNYQTVDSLQIWSGYWLGVIQTGVEMIVTPPGSSQVPAPMPKITNVQAVGGTADNWIVNIIATTAKGADRLLKFGVKPDATDGFDTKYDELKAPPPPYGLPVETYFSHPDWVPILGSKFNSDIRSSQGSHSWTFYVKPSENTLVTLSWDTISCPSTLEMIDHGNGTTIDLKTSKSYSFTENGLRSFTVDAKVTSVNEGQSIPTSFSLQQNYPNPFNPSTTIEFTVPQDGHVSLTIYNSLGQLVATVFDGTVQAGYIQKMTFDASRLSSGVYFSRLQYNGRTLLKKLVLMK